LESIARICKNGVNDLDTYFKHPKERADMFIENNISLSKIEEDVMLDTIEEEDIFVWTPKKIYHNWNKYSYFCTVWIRLNVSHALSLYYNFKHESLSEFHNIHIPLLQHIDSLEDPSDVNVTFKSQIIMPTSRYEIYKNYTTVTTDSWENTVQIKDRYPDYAWCIEDAIGCCDYTLLPNPLNITDDHEKHTIYYACLHIMNNCKILYEKHKDDDLYFYYVCFLDLFYYGASIGKMDDETLQTAVNNLSPLEMYYPHYNRAFTGYDLPNLFHVYSRLPLWGEKQETTTTIEYILQKCLPFASQQRGLLKIVNMYMTKQPSFKRVMVKIMWCLKANMYPGTPKSFNIPELIDIQYKCINMKRIENIDEFIVAVRMWIFLMCDGNDVYIKEASKCIDWDKFKAVTFNNATTDVKQTNIVYRYRKNSRTRNITMICSSILMNSVFKLKDTWTDASDVFCIASEDIRSILYYTRKVNKELHYTIDNTVKENILNLLITIPVNKRFSPNTLNILRVERYGNLSTNAVSVIYKLLYIYKISAKPQTYKNELDSLTIHEFKVVTWYFSIIWTLERIQFIPLDQTTIDKIDDAMRNTRYFLYKTQKLNPAVYNVCITICCNKLLTISGESTFGHDKIMYNMETKQMMCTKTTHNHVDEEEKIPTQNKKFKIIPCSENPVLQIPLKGFMLIYQTTAVKKKRYMHCPQCGSFHKYTYENWTDEYRCNTCVNKTKQKIHATCCMCNDVLSQKTLIRCTLLISSIEKGIEHLYFCKKHHKYAKRMNTRLMKGDLFEYVTKKVTEQNKKNAQIRY